MDDCLTNLARRLVAAPRWRWMPGLLATGEGWLGEARIVEVDDDDGAPVLWMYRGYSRGPATAHALGDRVGWSDSHSEPIPDLTDPATVGCLRALVEVDGRVVAPRLGDAFGGATLAEALVDALLHAPVQP